MANRSPSRQPSPPQRGAIRHLILVLGDQLDAHSSVFDGFDSKKDAVWMAENLHEASYVWSHKLRLAFFFAAMRHFAHALEAQGYTLFYHALSATADSDRGGDFSAILEQDVKTLKPQRLIIAEPGDYRVWMQLKETAKRLDIELEIRADRHFYCGIAEFRHWAEGRKSLLLETFYRQMRRKHQVLLDDDGEPVGGAWNFDKENRQTFGKAGPRELPTVKRFAPDEITQEVMAMVEQRFAGHPGSLEQMYLPVTAQEADAFLEDFIRHRLPLFGPYEDAMWGEEVFLYHSRLSALLNLKLLDPRRCIEAAVAAYRSGEAAIASVEGFVRQILGWREYIRGVYWLHMPDYGQLNALACEDRPVPGLFWHGNTEMNCLRSTMAMVLAHGYSHHIHRLMVTGLFAQLLGVHPYRFHEWHMAMYLDAIDWVSLPNTLGMSQYGDGGIVATKPYCASGSYIQKMGNYCSDCRYHPKRASGDDACPFTVFYWDFLARHRQRFEGNSRMALQLNNLKRKAHQGELKVIQEQAERYRRAVDAEQL